MKYFFVFLLLLNAAVSNAQRGPQASLYKIDFGFIYRMVNSSNGKDVEVEDGLFDKGKRVQQYRGYSRNGFVDGHNQEWIFIPAGSVTKSDGSVIYLVMVINYGFLDYLSAGRGGGQVTLEKLNSSGSNIGVLWEIMPTGNHQEIRLRSNSTNQFLQVPADNNDGSAMIVAPESNLPNQVFKLTKFSKDGLSSEIRQPAVLRPANSPSKALDVTGCGTANNTLLEIWDKGSNNLCQQFNITRIGFALGNIIRLAPVIAPTYNVRLQDPNAGYAGANIVIGDPSVDIATNWILVKCIREPGKYILFNFKGMCLEVWNNRTDNGGTIGQNSFMNTDNQKCIIETAN